MLNTTRIFFNNTPNAIRIFEKIVTFSNLPLHLSKNRKIYKSVGVNHLMVQLKKKIVNNNTYFYLEHSFREDGKVHKKEKYLGKELPANLENAKKQFFYDVASEKWFKKLDNIKLNYIAEEKLTPPSAKQKARDTFAVKFTYNTNRIEGSTLTLKETADLLDRGITPTHKPLEDIKETEAHKRVFIECMGYKKDLTQQIVLFWHKILFEGTKPDIAGKIRIHQVAISGSKYLPPLPIELESRLRDFFSWYHKSKDKLHSVELAALVHLKFVTIHPFSDGNGRLSRLLMNFVLHCKGYPLLDIPYINRSGYYTALERSQIKIDERIFVLWFFNRYIKENKIYSQ